MASINYAARQISVKIVYYGPGLSGKTTNLQVIHKKTPQEHRSDMVSLATETDRTLFFDFLPLDLGKIKGFDTKFQLYTVPGQVYYNATRKLVLRGVDGVVFVADSGADKIQENLESFQNLEDNLAEYGYQRESIPIIIQYNKRDLPNALPIDELNKHINKYNLPYGEGIAYKGVGVFDTLKQIGKIVIDYLNKKYSRGAGARSPAPESAPAAPTYQAPAYAPPPPAAPAYQAPAAAAFAPPPAPGYQQQYSAPGTPSYMPPPAQAYQAPAPSFAPPPPAAPGYQQPFGAAPYAAPQQQYQAAPPPSFEPPPAAQASPWAEPQSFEPTPAAQASPWAEPQSFEPTPATQESPWAEPQSFEPPSAVQAAPLAEPPSFEPAPAAQASPWAEPQSFEPAPTAQASPWAEPQSFEPAPAAQASPWAEPQSFEPAPAAQASPWAEPQSFEPAPAAQASPWAADTPSFEPPPATQAAPVAEPPSFEPPPAAQASPWVADAPSFEPPPAPSATQTSPWVADTPSFEPPPAAQASPWAQPQSFEPPPPAAAPALDPSSQWGATATPGAPPQQAQQGGTEQSPFSFEMASPPPSSHSGFDAQGGNEFDLSSFAEPTGAPAAHQGDVSLEFQPFNPQVGTASQGDGSDLDKEIEMYERKIEEQQKSMRSGGPAGFPAASSGTHEMQPFAGPGDNLQLSPFDPQADAQAAYAPVQPNDAYSDFEAELINGSLTRENFSGGSNYHTAESAMCFTSVDKNAARQKKPVKPPVNPSKAKAAQQQQKGGFGLPKLFNKNR